MNYLWAGMMLTAVIWGAVNGTIPQVTQAALDSSKEAVSLCVATLGILSFWMGLMQVGTAAGLIDRLTGAIRPFLKWMFPRIPDGHPALGHISVNCIANMLGLGWAATPAGLKAMEELSKLEEERRYPLPKGTASDEMCAFLILNISSLQLIPVNIIAYRAQYGSVDPAAVTVPSIAATAVSTGAAIIFCKVMYRRRKKQKS